MEWAARRVEAEEESTRRRRDICVASAEAGRSGESDEDDEAEAALVARMREASKLGAAPEATGSASGSASASAAASAPAAAPASIVSPTPRGGSSSFAPAAAPASSAAATSGFGMASAASPASHTSSGRSLSNSGSGGGAAAGSSGKPSPTRSPAPTTSGELSLAAKQAQRSQRASEGSGLLVIDSLQIEKLKLQFRNPESGKFDRALELLEFVEAFETVLGPGKSRKEFKQIFMKIEPTQMDPSIGTSSCHSCSARNRVAEQTLERMLWPLEKEGIMSYDLRGTFGGNRGHSHP